MTIIFAVSKWNNTAAETADKNVCASCGIAGVDSKLEECPDCQSVRYCSDKCREDHREQHNEECKKRKAELHDRKLFSQPEGTHWKDCPICFLPMPLDPQRTLFRSCCSRVICKGCDYANDMSNGNQNCPFCREPDPNKGEHDKRLKKRMKANDPAAWRQMGLECYEEGENDAAFGYLTKAAELGDADAHAQLGFMYERGQGVEKDKEKSIYHYEKAAIEGHPGARHNLACCEEENGNIERAVKHFIIAANLGHEESMKELWTNYSEGNITKRDLEVTLRSHQAAIDAMKSPQRDAAEAAFY